MRQMIRKTVVMLALLVVAVWMFSPSVHATEMKGPGQSGNTDVGSTTDIKQDIIDKSSPGLDENVVVPELTKDIERPINVPDPRSEMVMPDRRPLCGPWKNAINHYACAEGHDSY